MGRSRLGLLELRHLLVTLFDKDVYPGVGLEERWGGEFPPDKFSFDDIGMVWKDPRPTSRPHPHDSLVTPTLEGPFALS